MPVNHIAARHQILRVLQNQARGGVNIRLRVPLPGHPFHFRPGSPRPVAPIITRSTLQAYKCAVPGSGMGVFYMPDPGDGAALGSYYTEQGYALPSRRWLRGLSSYYARQDYALPSRRLVKGMGSYYAPQRYALPSRKSGLAGFFGRLFGLGDTPATGVSTDPSWLNSGVSTDPLISGSSGSDNFTPFGNPSPTFGYTPQSTVDSPELSSIQNAQSSYDLAYSLGTASPPGSAPTAAGVPAASSTVPPMSWFDGSTTIAGYTIPNMVLAAGGLGVIAFLAAYSGGKKGRR